MKKLHILGILVLLAFCLGGILSARAAGQQPADPEEERLSQIQQLILSGRLDEARGQVEETLRNHSGDVRLYNFLGVIYAQEKNFAQAETNFRRAIQIAPRFSDAYLNLGRLYQENAAVDPRAQEKALRLYGELVKFAPDNVEGNFQAAFLSSRLGAFVESQRYLDRLPAQAQKQTQASALRCANYVALGQLPQADRTAQQLLAHDDLTKADISPILAALAGHPADDFEMKFLAGIAARGLASAEALKELARLFEARGRYKDARGMLEQAVQIDPPSAQILFWMARVSYRAGDLEGALGYLAHARDLEPDNAAVHFFFGMICVELNLPADARKSLEQAVRLDPRNAYYNYALGAVLVQANNPDEAIRYFQQFRALRPADARATLAVAIAYFYSDRYDDARHELQSIADHSETRTAAQLFLGRMAMRDGNLAEAMDHLQRSIQADPSVIEPYTDLGMVYIDRKEYALAEKTLAHAIKMSPDDYLSNQRLLILFQRTKDPRADAQAIRVEQMRKTGEERARFLMRTVEVRPY
jgi:cytochrome c-type biogenesis protein CcmH/NrfG